MFRPLLAIFRLSWRTNLKSYYMYCARAWCRDLYITGFILYKMMWMRACRLSGPMVVRSAVLFLNEVRCVGGLVGVVSCLCSGVSMSSLFCFVPGWEWVRVFFTTVYCWRKQYTVVKKTHHTGGQTNTHMQCNNIYAYGTEKRQHVIRSQQSALKGADATQHKPTTHSKH